MPIIAITTWPTLGDAKSRELIEQVTATVHAVTGACWTRSWSISPRSPETAGAKPACSATTLISLPKAAD